MYTAKLSLSPDNVEDVLAVAGFLQMQEIVSACNALKSLSVPPENPTGMNQQPPEIGKYPPGFPSPRQSQDLATYASWSPKFIHWMLLGHLVNPVPGCIWYTWMVFNSLGQHQQLKNCHFCEFCGIWESS